MPLSPAQVASILTTVRSELDALVGLGELPGRVFSPLEGQIPLSKAHNLCRAAGITLEVGEEFVLLVDDTMFGSAHKGWAITTQRVLVAQPPVRGVLALTELDEVHRRVDGEEAEGVLVFEAAGASLAVTLQEHRQILYDILRRSFASANAVSF